MTELIERSAKALAAAIRGREVSAYEVVLAAIARIEAVNPQLNAVVQTRFDAALAEAQEADERLRQGESVGPLHGVPMTIKDSFDTADLIST
ncbi:MAG: amidase family protein, partial [Caldilineaceae bacterium]